MLVLGIDTATAATSVALVACTPAGQQVRARRSDLDPRAHGERLAPQIVEALAEAGAARTDLAAVVAGTGPGPFTGLRVGLVTAAAISHALAVPAYGICSLDGIGAATEGRVLVATDARRREVYWAVYADGQRVTGPAVNRPEDLLANLAGQMIGQAYGDGADRYREQLGLPVAEHPRYPDPARLVALAAPSLLAGVTGQPLRPRYLRRPDAAEPRPPKQVTPR